MINKFEYEGITLYFTCILIRFIIIKIGEKNWKFKIFILKRETAVGAMSSIARVFFSYLVLKFLKQSNFCELLATI